MVINTITHKDGRSEGLRRLESVLLEVFKEARIFVRPPREALGLTGVTIVAGDKLVAHEGEIPNAVPEPSAAIYEVLLRSQRKAQKGARVGTDDWHDLDYADADVRSVWRKNVLAHYGARALDD